MEFRTGDHNQRNIYIKGFNRETDIHIGVMFDPEMATTVVTALNRLFPNTDPVNNQGSVYVWLDKDQSESTTTREVTANINTDWSLDTMVGVEVLGAVSVEVDGRVVYP